ncbi:MAG: putative DNA binding domain-containing protein [Chromatiales bacterium]|nr:putative DNA binding domain-containing protein [Chromatiales bacterium]
MFSDSELIKRIHRGESDQVEFTESAKDLDKIRKVICAFANDLPGHNTPGVIFVGLRDDKSCAGLSIDDAILKNLSGLRGDGKILPSPIIEVAKKNLQNCEIAVIQVEPSKNTPIRAGNRCYIRVGPTCNQAAAEEEKHLTEKRDWQNLPYDMNGVADTSIEDHLDMEKFRRDYLPSAVTPEVLQENKRSTNEQMRALRLITPESKPTVTAILMLGNDVRYWFPGAYIQFVRYDGTEVTDPVMDQKEIDGTLAEQLKELDSILKANISTALDTSGETHAQLPDYPYEALRELVRNAVIHRDYQGCYTPIRVYWYADKITIVSPGGLYGVSRKNFGRGYTGYRNPTIAEAMKNMGFMQRFGMGLATVERTLKENGNKQASFDIQENFVSATVERRP